jgi:CO dehydrogenase maturation factor
MKIAITGKGGVGKTTLSGTLARLYAAAGRAVLAIDADPDTNLAAAVGIPAARMARVTPLSAMDDLIEERTGARPGAQAPYFKLNPRVSDLPDTLSVAHEGVRVMVMGTVKTGGGGCICPENVMLRSLVRHLLLERDEVVILDMVAGVEHLGRATADAVDAFIVVVEPGQRSIQTAHTIHRLAADIGIQHIYVVGNKVRTAEEQAFVEQAVGALPLLGLIRYRVEVIDADRKGMALYDIGGPAVEEIRSIQQELDRRLAEASVGQTTG